MLILMNWRRTLALLWAVLFPFAALLGLLVIMVGNDSGHLLTQIGPGDLFVIYLLALPISLLAGAISGFRNSSTSTMVLLPAPLVLTFVLFVIVFYGFII